MSVCLFYSFTFLNQILCLYVHALIYPGSKVSTCAGLDVQVWGTWLRRAERLCGAGREQGIRGEGQGELEGWLKAASPFPSPFPLTPKSSAGPTRLVEAGVRVSRSPVPVSVSTLCEKRGRMCLEEGRPGEHKSLGTCKTSHGRVGTSTGRGMGVSNHAVCGPRELRGPRVNTKQPKENQSLCSC